jgi:hypothetical protein
MSVILKLLFRGTNLYSQKAVACCLKIVHFLFMSLTLRAVPLPPDFDFYSLAHVIELLLTCDIARNMHNVLWFLYQHWGVFAGPKSTSVELEVRVFNQFFSFQPARSVVLDVLLGKHFESLFLHWSWFVRHRFCLLLMFRCGPLVDPDPTERVLAGTADPDYTNQEAMDTVLLGVGKNYTRFEWRRSGVHVCRCHYGNGQSPRLH